MNTKPSPRIILPRVKSGSSSGSPTLDSTPAGEENPPKRRCISSACMPCRRRKSKCDGGQPACNPCTSVYGSTCYYDIDSDHRRKGALKRDIAQLKEELTSQNIILEALRKGTEADVDDIIQLVRSDPDESYDSIADNVQKLTLAAAANKKLEPPSGLEGDLADFSVKPSVDGTGDTRHYGPTSNLALLEVDEGNSSVSGDQLGTWTSVTANAEFINHLFDVYFAWQHPFYVLFSEEVFFHGLKDKKLKYCTPLLVNAILAVACHFSDRPEARADPNDSTTVGNHFFAEAKRLLHIDDRSCLTTVQALGLMSLGSAMNNQDGGGWQHVSQMMGMVVQLGLHTSYAAQPNSKVTVSEIEAQRVTFWGCFVLQAIWAICVGRISPLPRNAIRLEKPCIRVHLEGKNWKPYGQLNYDGTSSQLEQPSYKYNILLQSSLLSEIVDDVIHMFYAPRDRITGRKLQQYHDKFQKWYGSLPEYMAVKENGPTLPQVLSLHMYYHNCVLHLFRPFLKVTFVQNAKSPRQICTESANIISQLAALYSRTYGMRRLLFINTHCITSAAIIHLVNISSSPSNTNPIAMDQAEIYLAEAMKCLNTSHQAFPISERYLNCITSLIDKWCPIIPPRLREAMAEMRIGNPSVGSTAIKSPVTSLGDNNPTPHPTNGLASPTEQQQTRKPSAPELLQMAPPSASLDIHTTNSTASSQQQQIFWTPFPDNLDGVPLALQQDLVAENRGGMDLTGMLDSGVEGDWPQLNRDGFTIGTGTEVEEGSVWGVNWEGSSGL